MKSLKLEEILNLIADFIIKLTLFKYDFQLIFANKLFHIVAPILWPHDSCGQGNVLFW